MPKGRPRLPKEEKKRRGTLRPSRVNDDAPEVELVEWLDPPAIIRESKAGIAKEKWDELVFQLVEMKMLCKADATGLVILCINYERWQICEEKLIKEGLTTWDGKRNPLTTIQRECGTVVERLLQQFGLTPATRDKVKAQKTGASGDPLGDLIKKAGAN